MKKIIAFILVLCAMCSCAFSEEATAIDVTYKYLYMNILSSMKSSAAEDNETRFDVTCVTVWKKNEEKAGFSFEGEEWSIYGETDMETGIITKVMAVLPYTRAGVAMTYMLTYTLSGMTSIEDFKEKYIGEDSVLKNREFDNYMITLDAGNEQTMVYEFSRVGSESLNNEANKCNMTELIMSLQQ